MEKRPTRQVYKEILMCVLIFYHLKDSRSHGNELEAERARGQGARPPHLGARPALVTNQGRSSGSCSTAFEDQGKPYCPHSFGRAI